MIRFLQGYCIGSREIKDHNIISFDLTESLQSFIGTLDPLQVGFSTQHGIGKEGNRQRGIGCSWSVGCLTYIEMIAHQQATLHGGGGNLIVLKQERY